MNYRDYRDYTSARRRGGSRNSRPARSWDDHRQRYSGVRDYYDDPREGMDHGHGARPTPRSGYYPEGYYYDPDRLNEIGRHDTYGGERRSFYDFEDKGSRGRPHYNYYESYPSYGQSAPYGDHERSWTGRDSRDTEYRYSDEDSHNDEYGNGYRRRYHPNRY